MIPIGGGFGSRYTSVNMRFRPLPESTVPAISLELTVTPTSESTKKEMGLAAGPTNGVHEWIAGESLVTTNELKVEQWQIVASRRSTEEDGANMLFLVFSSDRSGRSSECGNFAADHTVINIYVTSPDGTNIRRLSDNKDIDRYPHSLF